MSSRLRNSLVLLAALLGAGTLGYRLIEGWSLADSLYMTIITLSTVGYGEIRPLSSMGRMFTAALILLGVGTLAYIAARSVEALIEQGLMVKRRMRKEIRRMRDHVIVCGFGRMGQTVCGQLAERGTPFVVVERDSTTGEELTERGIPFVRGDATDDATLVEAGIHSARAVAAVLREDADNLFVTLSARKLNPRLTIVARSSTEKNESKMIAAGASRVLNPYRQGGQMMVRQLLHPAVTAFFEVIGTSDGSPLQLEEVRIQDGSSLSGVTLSEAPIRREMNVIVVAVRREAGELIFNPPPTLAPESGDVLIALGHRSNLRRLEELAEGPRGRGAL